MSGFGRLAGAPWRGPRRLGMTLRVSAADPFSQLTGASVFVGGIALVKSRSPIGWDNVLLYGASTNSTAVSCEAKDLAYKFARFWALPSPGASRASAVRPNQ